MRVAVIKSSSQYPACPECLQPATSPTHPPAMPRAWGCIPLDPIPHHTARPHIGHSHTSHHADALHHFAQSGFKLGCVVVCVRDWFSRLRVQRRIFSLRSLSCPRLTYTVSQGVSAGVPTCRACLKVSVSTLYHILVHACRVVGVSVLRVVSLWTCVER